MRFDIVLTGTRPLLLHNSRMASAFDPYAREMAKLTGKTKKTDDDRRAMARIEWEAGLYFDPQLGPYMPATNVFQSIYSGAKAVRQGTAVERSATMLGELELPLLYDGPRDIDGLYTAPGGQFIDERQVIVNRQRIVRTRPVFRRWALECSIGLDTTLMNPDEFERVVEIAGRTTGLGDYRRFFGRYEAKIVRGED